MKKKIMFTAYTLDVGGIETALINLLNELVKKYEITLVLEKKQGIFLNELNSAIKIIEYRPNQGKIVLIRKAINMFKRFKFITKHKNKYDFSASFATYSKMGSFCARTASKNSALWCHAKYSMLFNNKDEMVQFFKGLEFSKFSRIVFVSNEGASDFKDVFPDKSQDVLVCNNLIDYEKIINKSKEKIEFVPEKYPVFLNVSRQEEKQKRIKRIIEASKILKEENYKFKVLLIGDGPDSNNYKDLVKKYGLEQNIIFLGAIQNPYPYFKIANSLILTSEYEGYPVVFVEAMILKLPILTTNISDSMEEIDEKYGIVLNGNAPKEIANAMKRIIENNDKYKKDFDPKEFNEGIIKKIEILINGGQNAEN